MKSEFTGKFYKMSPVYPTFLVGTNKTFANCRRFQYVKPMDVLNSSMGPPPMIRQCAFFALCGLYNTNAVGRL